MITVNGDEISNADNLKLSDFLKREGYNSSLIAVECNGSIVPKSSYEDKKLEDGDSLEVVSFVGGG
ncbi:sulfur carrier protein ThiS [uncultured Clostridium sp.]|uniref:sulfur carrier protein ThiS n=1 Tax=uncultured Clostridium sp. TaxID=59620 RepID=UPI0025F82711|nr:sulfur carrier protein ThiS [uncultured Clostridium sp.]